MKTPIITHQHVSWPAKMSMLTMVAMLLVTIGFILGVYVSQTEPVSRPIEITIPLPEYDTRPYAPGPVSDKPEWTASATWEYDNLQSEIKCLADNMYFEGRNQTLEGKIGIGLVTINRVKSKHFRDNLCDVIWFQATDKRSGKLTAHFSWTLDNATGKITEKNIYERIYKIAGAMIAEGTLDNFHDFTEGATHYHASYITPYWAGDLLKIAQIDDHIYYR